MDQFKWMTTVTPSHIHHCHSAEMTQKSQVFQLPIEHKNESKYEEVLDIMDGYERFLQKIFQDAHGLFNWYLDILLIIKRGVEGGHKNQDTKCL